MTTIKCPYCDDFLDVDDYGDVFCLDGDCKARWPWDQDTDPLAHQAQVQHEAKELQFRLNLNRDSDSGSPRAGCPDSQTKPLTDS